MNQTLNLEPSPTVAETPARAGKISPLVWILAAGLIIRLLLLGWWSYNHIPIHSLPQDEGDYFRLAVAIAERGEYVSPTGQLISQRPPLQPVLIAASYWLFGPDHFLLACRAFQLVLSLLNVVVIYFLAKEAFSVRVAHWAGGLYCFYPSLLVYNNLLLTEVLFTFLLCAACLTVVRYFQREASAYLALAGVLIGLASLTRSVLWLSPPFLALYVLLFARSPFPRRFLAAGMMVAAFAITVGPWTYRNTQLEKTLIVIDSMGGRNFMMGNYEYTPLYRSWDAVAIQGGDQEWDHVLNLVDPTFGEMTQGQRDKRAMKYGLDYVKKNPGQTLFRDTIKFLQFWGLERELIKDGVDGHFGPLPKSAFLVFSGLVLLSYAGAMIAGIFGMILAPPGDRRLHFFFLLVMAFICGLHAIVFGHSRYHLPLMPLVLMYSASALVHWRVIWERRQSWPFRLAVGLCVLLVAGWMWVDVAVHFGLI